MIETSSNTYERTGNMTGQSIAMGIEKGAMAHIMNVLTNLYKDREAACLREVTTNAFDAHVEAGVTRPVEVTLPSPLAPFLRIRDYGVGLSVDDITNIYAQYGASTKRETNEQVGSFGLGCKAPLTYCDQFTLVSRKDGVRVEVVVSRNSEGGGEMTVVDTRSTDEGNGTEVVIPAKAQNAFAAKAAIFFSYWAPGTVLVNGQPPKHIEGLRINKNQIVAQGYVDQIVMGNVAYPTTTRIPTGLASGHCLVTYVPIGSVTLPPSREALIDTDLTKATLKQAADDYARDSKGAIQREIDKAKTPAEAIALREQWERVLDGNSVRSAAGRHVYKYKGRDIPREFAPPMSKDATGADLYPIMLVPAYNRVLSRHSRVRAIQAESFGKMIWVYNYDRPTFTPGQKKKMNKWAEDNQISGFRDYVMSKAKPDIAYWIDNAVMVDWKVIEAIKLPRAKGVTTTGRIAGSYDAWVVDKDGTEEWKSQMSGDDVDQKRPIYHLRGGYYEAANMVKGLRALHPGGFTIVTMPANRLDKWKRLVPTSKDPAEAVRAAADKWAKSISKDKLMRLAMENHYGLTEALRKLDASKIDDPDLKEAIRVAGIKVDNLKETRVSFQRVGAHVQLRLPAVKNHLDKYPLLGNNRNAPTQHSYIYINAVYAAQKKGA